MPLLLAIGVFLLGFLLVLFTLSSAIRTFVLPRGENVWLTRVIFRAIWVLFRLRIRWAKSEAEKERALGLFTPITLLCIPIVWLTLALFGFMGMFWAIGVRPWGEAFLLSGSSLLTLGFRPVENLPQTILSFLDATIGLILIALLIAYLPTMYGAFSRRETAVSLLEVYADSPPGAVNLIARIQRIHGLEYLSQIWQDWETWFAEVEESHTSFGPLSFFRSQNPQSSWVTAAGAVLDAAALSLAAVELPFNPRAALCIRAGYLSLRSIADFFELPYDTDPAPGDPISVTRQEFEQALERLAAGDVPLKADREQSWRDFAGWRVNYDAVLLGLAGLTLAPPAPWSSDRARTPL